jgi:hypothetical protein
MAAQIIQICPPAVVVTAGLTPRQIGGYGIIRRRALPAAVVVVASGSRIACGPDRDDRRHAHGWRGRLAGGSSDHARYVRRVPGSGEARPWLGARPGVQLSWSAAPVLM